MEEYSRNELKDILGHPDTDTDYMSGTNIEKEESLEEKNISPENEVRYGFDWDAVSFLNKKEAEILKGAKDTETLQKVWREIISHKTAKMSDEDINTKIIYPFHRELMRQTPTPSERAISIKLSQTVGTEMLKGYYEEIDFRPHPIIKFFCYDLYDVNDHTNNSTYDKHVLSGFLDEFLKKKYGAKPEKDSAISPTTKANAKEFVDWMLNSMRTRKMLSDVLWSYHKKSE